MTPKLNTKLKSNITKRKMQKKTLKDQQGTDALERHSPVIV